MTASTTSAMRPGSGRTFAFLAPIVLAVACNATGGPSTSVSQSHGGVPTERIVRFA